MSTRWASLQELTAAPLLSCLPLTPAFSSSSAFSSLFANHNPLTPFFSVRRIHSFSFFFTLKPVSPAVATDTKSTPGTHPISNIGVPKWNALTSLLNSSILFHSAPNLPQVPPPLPSIGGQTGWPPLRHSRQTARSLRSSCRSPCRNRCRTRRPLRNFRGQPVPGQNRKTRLPRPNQHLSHHRSHLHRQLAFQLSPPTQCRRSHRRPKNLLSSASIGPACLAPSATSPHPRAKAYLGFHPLPCPCMTPLRSRIHPDDSSPEF